MLEWFRDIVDLDSTFGFLTALLFMLALAFLMLYVFYRKKPADSFVMME